MSPAKPGESVIEQLRERNTQKALSTFAFNKRSPQEVAKAKEQWNQRIGGKRRRRPWK